MPNKIMVWETKDGHLFRDEEMAIHHDEILEKAADLKKNFENLKRELKKEGIKLYGYHDWDCKASPIGVCVYEEDEMYGDQCCYYCGGPEERK